MATRSALPLLLLVPLAALLGDAAPARAQARRVVTLAEALAATGGHPDLRRARAGTVATRARVDQTRAALRPQLSASASYRVDGSTRGEGVVYRPDDGLSAGVSASQLVWDFGQARLRVRLAEASVELAESGEGAIVLATRARVRSAFFAARAQRALLSVARETLTNEERHLDQVQRFVAAGARPEIDLYQVRAAVANARVAVVGAENAYEIAKAELNLAMGVEGGTDFDVADESLAPVPGEELSTEALLAEALAGRPELRAVEIDRRAQELALESAHRAFYPTLRASGGADGVLLAGEPAWGWSAALNLSWSLLDGGARRAAIRETEAGLLGLDAEAAGVRGDVRLAIERARLAVRGAREALASSGEAVENARVRLRLAEGRYAAGVGSAIELFDAQLALSQAAGQQIRAEYDLASARGELLDALGRG